MSTSSFSFPTQPVADPAAVVSGPNFRFTVFTPRLVRLEFAPDGVFEDRPSQAFWYRKQPVPLFEKDTTPDSIHIHTEFLDLKYKISTEGFTAKTLSIELVKQSTVWHFGDRAWPENLQGTGRTLDEANGPIHLENGLTSRSGWAVYDDSRSLVFNDDGWLELRPDKPAQDLYFFGYGHDFAGCLKDFTRLAGGVPMLPRWMLGNWWSRYWPYTQAELTALMQDFRAHEIPLAVCIVDMDWHITRTGNASTGWTGYTWNRDLFPDPPAFMRWLHEQGLRTALNLHPAEGIYPHEEQYPQMAKYMGIDPASQEPVPFDISDPHFMRGYFDILHHPMEEQGVDFWWLDWQQGTQSKVSHLDPLWLLNHLHFLDSGRDPASRPVIFSRWGGLGNHRYPIGFSGDTHVTWESLAFQPYFTSTAANVGYGWWSHDIGGHMQGLEDRELYTRWVQFGVFSPILRLHSTCNAYQERRPWGFDVEVLEVTRTAMRLRHSLIPYLYSMAWRNTTQGLPLVTPMYYGWPDEGEAYHCSDQYTFGSELVAAPFLTPSNPDTRLSRGSVWLPEGDWFNFFTGEHHEGGKWHPLFGALADVPVFAKAGGIVPLAPDVNWGGTENPNGLTLVIFPGAGGRFDLFEDDGVSQAYLDGRSCITRIDQIWTGDRLNLSVGPASGDLSQAPAVRTYTLVWRGIRQPASIDATIDGKPVEVTSSYDAATESLTLTGISLRSSSRLAVTVRAPVSQPLMSKRDRTLVTLRKALHAFRCNPDVKRQVDERLEELLADPRLLVSFERLLTEAQISVLMQLMG